MEIDLIVYAGIGILVILMLLMFVSRESETKRKFMRFERAIEDLIQQNHQLRRDILKREKEDKARIATFEQQIHNKVQDEINSNVIPLLETLKDIELVMQEFQDEQQDRMFSLEERTKSFNKFTSPSVTTNDKQILQAYQTGKSVDAIAKDLRIGIGEVEFTLKMNHLL